MHVEFPERFNMADYFPIRTSKRREHMPSIEKSRSILTL